MKKISNIWLIALILTVAISFISCSVIAADTTQAPPNAPPGNGPGMDKMLQNLTAKGYDVSKIQAAVTSGDNETARKLLDEFWTAHPDAKPQRPQMDAEQLKKMVADLAGKGNDVSKIQTALDSGNVSEAQTLFDEFIKAHPDAMPKPADGEKPAQ
jgi:hypothetical protein